MRVCGRSATEKCIKLSYVLNLLKIRRLCNCTWEYTSAKGYITVEVLRDILHELDDKIPPGDLDLMISEIDADGSGTVDFQGIHILLVFCSLAHDTHNSIQFGCSQ